MPEITSECATYLGLIVGHGGMEGRWQVEKSGPTNLIGPSEVILYEACTVCQPEGHTLRQSPLTLHRKCIYSRSDQVSLSYCAPHKNMDKFGNHSSAYVVNPTIWTLSTHTLCLHNQDQDNIITKNICILACKINSETCHIYEFLQKAEKVQIIYAVQWKKPAAHGLRNWNKGI